MTSTPVAGQLGALGKVHGVWNESADEYGDYMGPDTLRAPHCQGSFHCRIQRARRYAVHHLAGGARQEVEPQLASDGTGAYARTKESGTIDADHQFRRARSSRA